MRKVIFIFWIVFPLLGISQKAKGTIFLLDGKSIEGTVKVSSGGVKYWLDENAEPEKYSYDRASSVVLTNNKGEKIKYEYVYFDFQKKPILLKVEKEGYLTLYSDSSDYYTPGGPTMGFRSTSTFYLKKRPDKLGQWYLCNGYIPKHEFHSVIETYFTDCKELQEKYAKREFRQRDYVEIVNFYNQNCAPKE